MDRNTIIGVTLLVLALGLLFFKPVSPERNREPKPEQAETKRTAAPDAAPLPSPSLIQEKTSPDSLGFAEVTSSETPLVATDALIEEKTYVLENDFIAVTFTSHGGAIKAVALKRHPDGPASRDHPEKDPYRINASSPLAALAIGLDADLGDVQSHLTPYQMEAQQKQRLRFVLDLEEGIQVVRDYRIFTDSEEKDPYLIEHETRFINRTEKAFSLRRLYLNVGTARPSERERQDIFLNFGAYNGKRVRYTHIKQLTGSKGFFGLFQRDPQPFLKESTAPVIWGCVKNQFFTSILMPETPGTGIYVKNVDLLDSGETSLQGITGSVRFDLESIPSNGEQAIKADYFVGPLEFKRLQAFSENQDKTLQFPTVIGFLSKALLSSMLLIHAAVPNWGWTIIILTLCIKILVWPLTAKATRSQKAMQKLQAPLKALQEKYKDNPQKLHPEMVKLFKAHKTTPLSGCLPLLIQMPIFIALFYTLRSAAELRLASFLWVQDLSQPDTVASIAGFPINVLPLIMGGTMLLQLRLVPSTSSANQAQRLLFKFVPLIFFVICYNFSSGLVLYWTIQNILTLLQQYLIFRKKDTEEAEVAVKHGRKKRDKKAAS